MILICYDGSPDAKAAIERGAALLKDQEPVTVLTVWQPFVEVLAHMPSEFGPAPSGLRGDRQGHAHQRRGARRRGGKARSQGWADRTASNVLTGNEHSGGDPRPG
jgi:hypothetical protein